jgi:hypothetical protein
VTCTLREVYPGASGNDVVMTASLVYLLLRQILQMLTQLARDGGAKDVEWVRCQCAWRRRPVTGTG